MFKVEPPQGGGRWRTLQSDHPELDSYSFLLLNANKQSLTLNLKHPEAQQRFYTLIAQSDVIVENYGPGVMECLGLSDTTLQRVNPRLIYASIKGFGAHGTYRQYTCFEQIAQATSGAMSVTGQPDGPPMAMGIDVGESGTGMLAVIGILAALMQRQQTGRGQRVDVAMQDALVHFTRSQFTPCLTTGAPTPRGGNGAPEGGFVALLRYAPGGPNDYVSVRIPPDSPAMFEAALRAIGQEALLNDPRFRSPQERFAHQEALRNIFATWTCTREKQTVMHTLANAGVACGAVLDTQEVLADPHLRASGMIQDLDHPTRGRYPMIGSPVHLADSSVDLQVAPLHGEQTEQILSIWRLQAKSAPLRRRRAPPGRLADPTSAD